MNEDVTNKIIKKAEELTNIDVIRPETIPITAGMIILAEALDNLSTQVKQLYNFLDSLPKAPGVKVKE